MPGPGAERRAGIFRARAGSVNAAIRFSLLHAVSLLALGAGGCARTGGNTGQGTATDLSPAATPPAVSFTQADRDGDARITRQEFDLWRRAHATSGQAAAGGTGAQDAFDAADANLNGVLTLDEWQAVLSPAAR